MSRYRGPRLRFQRRFGVPLNYLTQKRIKKKKRLGTLPGQHGYGRQKVRRSEFRLRLEEKQKLKCNYSLTENQLFRYVKEARRLPGSTGVIILQLLEMRLDTIVYRLHLSPTILAARQLVCHGHVKVNGQIVTIPSFQCQTEDRIQISEKNAIQTLINENPNLQKKKFLPPHLSRKEKEFGGRVRRLVDRRDIGLRVNELLVVEYYSRR